MILKPCPFCGCDAETYYESEVHFVSCMNCTAEIANENYELAVEHWNKAIRRADIIRLVEIAETENV